MQCQDLRNIRIIVENVLETKVGQKFLSENEIYQNFSTQKYLKLNQRSSRFGRTIKRKQFEDMVYNEKVIEDDDKDDTDEKIGKLHFLT